MSDHRHTPAGDVPAELLIGDTIRQAIQETEAGVCPVPSPEKVAKQVKPDGSSSGGFSGALQDFIKDVQSNDFTDFPVIVGDGKVFDIRNLYMRGMMTLSEKEKTYLIMSILGGQTIDFRDPAQSAALEEKKNEYALKLNALTFKKTMSIIGVVGAGFFAVLIIGLFVWVTTQKGVSSDTGGFLKGALDNVIEALKLIISL